MSGLVCHNEALKSYALGMNTALRVFDTAVRDKIQTLLLRQSSLSQIINKETCLLPVAEERSAEE